MSTRLLAALAVLLLVVACTGDAGTTSSTAATTTETTAAPATTSGDSTTTSPPETTTSTTLLPGTDELPEEIRLELAELMEITEDVRQLEFLSTPNIVVVSDEELAERVRENLEEDLVDLPADQALYRLLGLLEPDTDLEQLYSDLYSEQVLGYYDGRVDELVVTVTDEGFSSLQKATLLHELVHALTDQHYDFHADYVELLDNDRYDEAAANLALSEGDATLAELLYLQGLTAEEQAEFFADSFDIEQEAFDAAPLFIQESLIFPYNNGLLFADRLYQSGGFDAIADAYASPPISTEQIIDPEDYPDETPVSVATPNVTLDGYEVEYESTWGELGFALMFDQVLNTDTSDVAAGGWGGDAYQILFDGTEVVLVLSYRGDSETDGAELASALGEYVVAAMDVGEESEMDGGRAWIGDDAAWVSASGSDVLFVAASDEEAFQEAVAAMTETSETTETTEG